MGRFSHYNFGIWMVTIALGLFILEVTGTIDIIRNWP